jgi:hypothetical protein
MPTFFWSPVTLLNRMPVISNHAMNDLGLYLLVELCLAFGLATFFWPDKFQPLFEVLLFPWAASRRIVRIHSLIAIGAYLLLLIKLLTRWF